MRGGFLEIDGQQNKNNKNTFGRRHWSYDTSMRNWQLMLKDYSLVNLNRAGVPLMELVTEPDITSGKEAREFAEELQTDF